MGKISSNNREKRKGSKPDKRGDHLTFNSFKKLMGDTSPGQFLKEKAISRK